MFGNCGSVGIVCHDAGAANIILYALTEEQAERFTFFLSGPAAEIWERKTLKSYKKKFSEQDFLEIKKLYLGTGLTNYEFDALQLGNELGKHTVSVIDHWCNYKERFNRNGTTILPNEIYVTDEYAYKRAISHFPAEIIRVVKNFYLQDQITKINQFKKKRKRTTILYICEPKKLSFHGRKVDEFFLLKDFLKKLSMANNVEFDLILRPHPSEPKAKYDKIVDIFQNLNIFISGSPEICCDIAISEVVVGYESFGLAIAYLAGKKVYSVAPDWAPKISLPYDEILSVKELSLVL